MIEKSGIELLEEILERLGAIEKKINVLEQNIKSIANSTKVAELINKAIETQLPGWTKEQIRQSTVTTNIQEDISGIKSEIGGFKNFKFESSDASKMPGEQILAQKQRVVIKNIVVQGKMVTNIDNKIMPLANITVRIYNDKDVMVKETKTNRAGQWVSHLPPGKYVALFDGVFNGKKLVPQNRNFIVPERLPEGKQEMEVS